MTVRQHLREYALDGAQLYFQPASGVHVRVATAATAALSRSAPRVVMFGITNACNLACDFCSRDVTRLSAWTVGTAAEALRGLHDANNKQSNNKQKTNKAQQTKPPIKQNNKQSHP